MKSLCVVLAVLSSSALVLAKPLPAGVKVTAVNNKLMVTMNGVTVPLVEPTDERGGEMFGNDGSASLSEDGKNIVVTDVGCTVGEDPIIVPLTHVQARLDNVAGMKQHLTKKYPEAIAKFSAAVGGDPDELVFQTNLLSAQSMGGKLDDADKTLATYGPKNLAWYGWRLAVDSDLKALRDRPSVKALVGATPSKLTLAKLGNDLAISPLGMVGVAEWVAFGMGPGASDFAIYDTKTGRQLIRLPLQALEDACIEKPSGQEAQMGMVKCGPKQLAHTAANTKQVEAMLQILGFDKAPTIAIESHGKSGASKDKQWIFNTDVDKPALVHGKTRIEIPADVQSDWLDIYVAGKVVLFQYRTSYGCGGADSRQSMSSVTHAP
jgi:hypothetical protein